MLGVAPRDSLRPGREWLALPSMRDRLGVTGLSSAQDQLVAAPVQRRPSGPRRGRLASVQ